MAVPTIIEQGANIISIPQCAKCGQRLHYKEYKNAQGVPCIKTKVIVENFCSNCGEPVDGFKEEQ